MSQRVVVTGGAGFIGAVLLERLLDEGHHVAVLDNFWRGSMANLRSVADHAHLTVIEGDVTVADDLERCRQALGEVDLVHHLAAINGTKWFDEAALDVIEVNINGTLVALRKAQDGGSLRAGLFAEALAKTKVCHWATRTPASSRRFSSPAFFLRCEQIS